MVTVSEVGQDRNGREGDQHSPDHVTRYPARDHQKQGASAVHHLLQIEGHTAKRGKGRGDEVRGEGQGSREASRIRIRINEKICAMNE